MVLTAASLVVGAVIALVFAATLALVMTLATALLGLTALVMRVRRRSRAVHLEARKVGHTWVTYSWDAR